MTKPLKILVAVNVLEAVDSQAYPSHLVHAYRMGRDTDVEFLLYLPRRMPIAAARNGAVKVALEQDCDYVFFYDDDMELNSSTFKTLLSRDRDIIMAMCYIRGYPYKPMVFKWVDCDNSETRILDQTVKGKLITRWDDCEQFIDENGLINNVAAVGCAATLIKVDVFRKLDDPWFYTGSANTEDVFFCVKAQGAIPYLTIAVDTTVPAGHILRDRHVLYPMNADILRKQDEEYTEFAIKVREAHIGCQIETSAPAPQSNQQEEKKPKIYSDLCTGPNGGRYRWSDVKQSYERVDLTRNTAQRVSENPPLVSDVPGSL